MYRHLLVPVDDTDLSVEVVGNAVALARPLGARITFFHAVADVAGSLRGDAEVLRLTARGVPVPTPEASAPRRRGVQQTSAVTARCPRESSQPEARS